MGQTRRITAAGGGSIKGNLFAILAPVIPAERRKCAAQSRDLQRVRLDARGPG